MKTKYIDVDGAWGVVVCYDLRRLDEYAMRRYMMAFGMRGESLDHAIDVLLFHENTGMCVTSMEDRMSLIFIGQATDEGQWWDTCAHELLYHAACAICDYYGVEYGSEDAAWLCGYLMRMAVREMGEPCDEKREG